MLSSLKPVMFSYLPLLGSQTPSTMSTPSIKTITPVGNLILIRDLLQARSDYTEGHDLPHETSEEHLDELCRLDLLRLQFSKCLMWPTSRVNETPLERQMRGRSRMLFERSWRHDRPLAIDGDTDDQWGGNTVPTRRDRAPGSTGHMLLKVLCSLNDGMTRIEWHREELAYASDRENEYLHPEAMDKVTQLQSCYDQLLESLRAGYE